MKRLIIGLLMLLLLAGCTRDVDAQAKKTMEDYVKTLNSADLDAQMKIMEPFGVDPQVYQQSFLRYVKKAKLTSIEKKYDNELIMIYELKMELTLSEDFPGNGRLKPGINHVTRFFTFKQKDMKLIEILDKLILQEEQ